MSSKGKVLFVDDDRYFTREYLGELSSRFSVDARYDATSACDALNSDIHYAAAIIDVMMPSPEGLESETRDGMSTGIWLIKKCREMIEAHNTAIVVFTNRSSQSIAAECEGLRFPHNLLTIAHKFAVPAGQLSDLVDSAISRARISK